MDLISKYLFRGAGFLVAAQVFLTFGLTDVGVLEKLKFAFVTAMIPVPLLAAAAFFSSENPLRAIGFTILLWAGAGASLFLGAAYGGAEASGIPGVEVPSAAEVSLAFGMTNLVLVLLIGAAVWLVGLKHEPAPPVYHRVGGV